jgi:uncharacterized protein (TIGR01777 family)
MKNFLPPPQQKTRNTVRLAETVVVAGGSGYLGRALVRELLAHGHSVMIATRNPSKTLRQPGFPVHPRLAVFDLHKQPPHQPTVVINLCGENIAAKRWSSKRKQVLIDSRIDPTLLLVNRCNRDWPQVHSFINASAIGLYGDHGSAWIDEDSRCGNDFAAQLCQQWELCLQPLRPDIRRIHSRLGVVIGEARSGSFLGRLLPAYRFCMGAQLGNGQHWFSWIHRQDAAAALCFLMENYRCQGSYNLCAPQAVRHQRLHYLIAKVLKRPSKLRLPAAAIRLLFGEMAQLLLCSQRVTPRRLAKAGFEFQYPNLHGALYHAITGRQPTNGLPLPKLARLAAHHRPRHPAAERQ